MAGLPAANQRRHRIRARTVSLLIGLFCALAWAEQPAGEAYEVGQRWVYQHRGPRPGSVEPNVIDGERILHVISVVDGHQGRQWVIEERFTKSPDVTGRLYVNQERMLVALEIVNQKGEAAKLRYDPPIPYRATDVNVGERQKIETALRMDSADFSLPIVISIDRLEDETITTPAGEFAGCRHYRVKTLSTLNIRIAKVPITEEREQWYHGSVNGMVKEVYRRGPVKFLTWSREGYTATSVLTAFGKEEVEAAMESEVKDQRGDEQGRPQPEGSTRGKVGLIVLGAIGALAMGGVAFAKVCGRGRRGA